MNTAASGNISPGNHAFVVAALYKFVSLPDFADRRGPLQQACNDAGTSGTLLLAHEGINGTIAGSRAAIDTVLNHIRRIPGCADLDHKESHADKNPFHRMKVRLKKEIVTLGVEGIDPNDVVGTYVAPEDWNDLIRDPDVLVIDTRNDYEVSIGTFEGAINPETTTFRDFPAWFRAHRQEYEGKKVAMFCTGGIRCEKSTAFLKSEGIDDVYHLQGGILKYLENVPEDQSSWQGECFVFDQRVSVGHGLALGTWNMCHACRMPIDDADMASEHYIKGVSCPLCHDKTSAAQKQRYTERQKQIEHARARGEVHIGATQPGATPHPTKPTPDEMETG
jgi:UPF0176 protein